MIVGAGPTGASAAILLAQLGVPSVVLERWDDVYPQPRAVHLDDEVFRVLARMGVADAFAAVSRPGGGLRLVDRDLRVLGEFRRDGDSATNGRPRANMFDQPDLERVLRRRMAELDLVDLRGGAEVLAVDRHDRGAQVRWRRAATGDVETIDAAYVLGCDGARSLVRESIGSTMTDLGFEQRWLVVDVDTPVDLGQWDGVQQVCDAHRAATSMQIGATRHRWEVRLRPDEHADDFATIESLLPLLRRWVHDVPASRLRLVRTAEYTFRAQVADRWRSGPVFLLGDAAHLTPPFIGQGLGAGVRDAANLAWKIAGVLHGSLPVEALDTYAQERRPHARALVQLARLTGLAMTGGGRVGDAARRVAVPAMQLVPAVRAAVADSATPPLQASRLVLASRRDRLAGRLCPDVGPGGTRLDVLSGGGWSVVTLEPPAPSDRAALAHRDVVVVEADGSPLADWLRAGRASAAVVRPDGTVLTSTSRVVEAVATVTGLLAPARAAHPLPTAAGAS